MVDLKETKERYERLLLRSVLPFWLEHGMDNENGGIYTGLSRDGSLIESDKSVWFQGRALWTFSTAYMKYKDPQYLKAADSLVHFLEEHCFDSDGRMFFRVSADGRPVIKRLRYFFSETFAVIGFAAYARATGKDEYSQKALILLEMIEDMRRTPGTLIPKFNPQVEPSRSFGEPMILLNVMAELRESCPYMEDGINRYIDRLLDEIRTYFVRPDMKLVLEQCAPDGTFMKDHFEGRILNPGHAIEGSWFIMNEGIRRGRDDLKRLGLEILDWEWDLGWDEEYGGGIIQYRDALGLPLSEYHQDMKFWWPQCEALIATQYAWNLTRKPRWLNWHRKVREWTYARMPDRKFGEWYGYLHRDGTVAQPAKGNLFKGPFHVPRMMIRSIELEEASR